MSRFRARRRATVRALHLAAVLALVLSTVLGSILQADPAAAKDRGRKDGRPASARESGARNGRVVNGRPAAEGEFPFAAYVQTEKIVDGQSYQASKCTGSLVADQWVLTAAHCFQADHTGTSVILGSVDPANEALRTKVRASEVFLHPDYTYVQYESPDPRDVALVHLENPVPFGANGLTAIGIPRAGSVSLTSFLSQLTAVGFGRTSIDDASNHSLMVANLLYSSIDHCDTLTSLPDWQLPFAFCATNPNGWDGNGPDDLCMGDSGGPIFHRGGSAQYGIAWQGYCDALLSPPLFIKTDEPSVNAFITETLRTTDATAPSVSITSPRPNANVSSTFQIDATVTDGRSGISAVEFWACSDTCTLLGTDLSAPYQLPLVLLPAGKSYTLLARAYDNAGNRGESVRVPITAEEGKATGKEPKLSCRALEEDPADEDLHLDARPCNLYYRPGSGAATVDLVVEATVKGGGSIASVDFPELLGAPGGAGAPVPGSPINWQFRYAIPASGLAAGAAPVFPTISATTSGNKSKGIALSVIPDSQAPTVRIKQPKDWFATNGSVNVKIEANDPNPKGFTSSGLGRVELFRRGSDGGGSSLGIDTEAPYSFTITPLAGPQSLFAVAYDNVGNRTHSETIHVCGGSSCEDDPGPGPSPSPTPPPPGQIDPDGWRTAEMVPQLPFSQLLVTELLSIAADDPECIDETNDPTRYEASAWYRVNLPNDAQLRVSTAGSLYEGPDPGDRALDTVLLIAVRTGSGWSVLQCVDDANGTSQAEFTVGVRRATDYYVMAGVFAGGPRRESGYILVNMDEAGASGAQVQDRNGRGKEARRR